MNYTHWKERIISFWIEFLEWITNIFLSTNEAVKTFLAAFLSDLFQEYLTEFTICILSQSLAFLVTSGLLIYLLAWTWKGIGYIVVKIGTLTFVSFGDAIIYLLKKGINAPFLILAWFFSSVAKGLENIFTRKP